MVCPERVVPMVSGLVIGWFEIRFGKLASEDVPVLILPLHDDVLHEFRRKAGDFHYNAAKFLTDFLPDFHDLNFLRIYIRRMDDTLQHFTIIFRYSGLGAANLTTFGRNRITKTLTPGTIFIPLKIGNHEETLANRRKRKV